MSSSHEHDLNLYREANALALEILELTKAGLLVTLRFLDMALCQLVPQSQPIMALATDGRLLYYDTSYILDRYKNSREDVNREYLHMIMHCIFHHPFIETLLDVECWDLACDIAAEAATLELNVKIAATGKDAPQKKVITDLQRQLKFLTAEKLYRHFLDQNLSPEKKKQMQELFYRDSHTFWHNPGDGKQDSKVNAKDKKTGDQDIENNNTANLSGNNETDEGEQSQEGVNNTASGLSGIKKAWQQISERAQVDLETISKQWGKDSSNLLQSIHNVTREKYDYSQFLKKFSVMGEVMKVNEDEFDYIFYTYGLKLYKRIPLIEPLEYKETKLVREFVIAIDTSGSCSGELVQKFIEKTYNILLETESFFSKVNIHIIQCDTVIQEDYKITNRAEFDNFIRDVKLKGFGGTDFRPVFDYVDRLITQKEFSNLKGLIYFTDGHGTFPQQKPAYESAFIFLDDDYGTPAVPPWAIKLVLGSYDI